MKDQHKRIQGQIKILFLVVSLRELKKKKEAKLTRVGVYLPSYAGRVHTSNPLLCVTLSKHTIKDTVVLYAI